MHTLLEFLRSHRMMMIIVAVVALLAAVAWNFSPAPQKTASVGFGVASDMVTTANRALMVESAAMPTVAPSPDFSPTAGVTAAEVDQKVIKTGSLELVADSALDATRQIAAIAQELKGFVQTSSVSELADGTHVGNITVRVPAAQFEAAMTRIKAAASVVRNETATGQDVTEQYTDLQARLRNAKAQEETYLAVLKQAQSVEDILKVQERLGYIRAEIESMQGRLQYLENVTAYSTISVTVEEEPAVRAPTKEFRPLAVAKATIQTLIGMGQALVEWLIRLIIIVIALIPLVLIVWVGVKIARRSRKNRL